MLTFQLFVEGDNLGALNLYSRQLHNKLVGVAEHFVETGNLPWDEWRPLNR